MNIPKTSGIYKIVNPNGEVYIGQTVNFYNRYLSYKYNPLKQQTKLKNSFNIYGFENHTFEIIEECESNFLNEKELYWGLYYNVLGNLGLNCRLGHGKGFLRDSTKQKISQSLTGKKQLQSTIDKRTAKLKGRKGDLVESVNKSEAKLLYYQQNSFTWGDKISQSKTGKSRLPFTETHKNRLRKPIDQFNIQGEFIASFSGAVEAEKITGVKFDNISMCLRGKSKSAGGFIWRYKI